MVFSLAPNDKKVLGAKSASTNSGFAWSDGSEWDYEPDAVSIHGNEDYLGMNLAGNWEDYTFIFNFPYAVCQKRNINFWNIFGTTVFSVNPEAIFSKVILVKNDDFTCGFKGS